MNKLILVWFRNDLRIHDNEVLLEATRKGDAIVPVYCFDPRHYGPTSYGTRKTGPIRAQFILESVADLKRNLQALGGNLITLMGKPEELIPQVAVQYGVHEVYHHREVATEEIDVSERVETALWKHKINLKHFIGHTLYHKEHLPFPIKDIPDVFTNFRKKVEKESTVRPCFSEPSSISIPENLLVDHLPSLSNLGYDGQSSLDSRAVLQFKGGESEGLKRMQEYFWEHDALRTYKETRNGLLGANYSSKFSAWIALGCLSPRKVYWEIKKYEKERVANESTYWLIFELLWRDYFRFMFKKHGNKFFLKAGFKGKAPAEASNQKQLFEQWKTGQTGVPFIDANMLELNATGFMSNRGRQNVASFLVKELQVNWTWGAAYFEEQLIDYCPANNWGNWAYLAGVGNDLREDRHFNTAKQVQLYDPAGKYVQLWKDAN
jgi:deoxyribodipyrimidine photo-lyase